MKVFFGIYFFFKASLLSCHVDVEQGFERGRRHYKIKRVAKLAPQIPESSGLVCLNDSTFLTHNDSGRTPVIYTVNLQGEVIDSLVFPQPNKDWESIDYDPQTQTLFIADIGNNRNNRKDMQIYAYEMGNEHIKELSIETIPVSYADQKEFPPAMEQRNFDCEAVAYYQGKLFLFSKNRGTDRATKQYTLPLESHSALGQLEPVASQLLNKQMVTGAAINPSGTVLALITYGRIYLFKIDSQNPNLLQDPWRVVKCNRMGQSEAVTFLNDEELMFTNEQGKMFRVTPK